MTAMQPMGSVATKQGCQTSRWQRQGWWTLLWLCLAGGLLQPGLSTVRAGEIPGLRAQITEALRTYLLPQLPRGASVSVVAAFPYRDPSKPALDGLSSQFSARLDRETRGALTALGVPLDPASLALERTSTGLDPCLQPDISRVVITGEYAKEGQELVVTYRICNRETLRDRVKILNLPAETISELVWMPKERKPSNVILSNPVVVTLPSQPTGAGGGAQPMAPQAKVGTPAAPSAGPSVGAGTGPSPLADLTIEVAPDRGAGAFYHLGETIQLRVRANRDCWVYVWHTDAEGELQLLFPNIMDGENHLMGGLTRTIGLPGAVAGSFPIILPTGLETLRVVAQEGQQFGDYDDIMGQLSWERPLWKVRVESLAQVRRAVTKGVGLWTPSAPRLSTAPAGVKVRRQATSTAYFTVLR